MSDHGIFLDESMDDSPFTETHYHWMSGELVERYLGRVEWAVERVIPLGGVSVLYGPSGAGKTWHGLGLAGAVATGKGLAQPEGDPWPGLLRGC